MFIPPDTVVQALKELAIEPWRGPEQVEQLRELATNPHHLRLFFGRLADPAWLTPLYEAGLMQLPQPDLPWPVAGLLDRLGRRLPAEVGGLLERMLADCKKKLPREQHVGARFELLRVASQLGTAGHPVVAGVVALHPGNLAVRALAVGVTKRADPADPVIQQVADTVLNGKLLDGDRYYAGAVLDHLEAGLDAGNVADRTRMLAAKVRRAARDSDMRFVALDIARLTAELGDERDYVAIVTHHLVRLLSRARELAVSTSELLAWTDMIPGEVGERITCRILAEADDVPLQDKINYITPPTSPPGNADRTAGAAATSVYSPSSSTTTPTSSTGWSPAAAPTATPTVSAGTSATYR